MSIRNALLVLSVLALAACGDDGEGSRAAQPTATRTHTHTPAPTATLPPAPSASATATRAPTRTPAATQTATPTATATETSTATALPTTPPLTSATVRQRGPFGIGYVTLTLVDASRPTMANGTYPGAPTRTLVTEVWYPTDPDPTAPREGRQGAEITSSGGPYPLVIHSHGFMDTRNGAAFLNRHLASHGYIVAAPDFPLTNFNAPGGANILDVINQPRDVSFVIDRMLAHEAFGPQIDSERIALSGLSLGGLTTFLAAFHPDLRDPRVRAAAPFAGPACFFTDRFYAHAGVPLLVLHGSIDAIVAYEENALFAFSQAHAPKYLVTLRDASHTGFSDVAALLFENLNNADEIGCSALVGEIPPPGEGPSIADFLGGEEAGVIDGNCPLPCPDPPPLPRAMRPSRQHDLTILSVFPFFESYLRNRQDMRQFLEQTLAAENADVSTQLDIP